MKKLIFALLLISLGSYSQTVNVDLVVRNIIPVDLNNYITEAAALTVPAGRIWLIQSYKKLLLEAKPIGFSQYKRLDSAANS